MLTSTKQPIVPLSRQVEDRLRRHLTFLYGETESAPLLERLLAMLARFQARNPHLSDRNRPLSPAKRLTERDAILITYGDQFTEPGHAPLHTLADFLREHLGDALSGVHILPFFPYSSDDGFSVIDYKKVNLALGGWQEIGRIGQHYRLMFDAVINHISRQSDWFRRFREGDVRYADYFITASADTDLSTVVRPRALPLLTPVETAFGKRYVWTTFSADQIDLNFHTPVVLLDVTDVILFYVEQGAQIIRLDAIAYLWKEIGTSCIHLPQTHAIIKFWRAVLDAVAPDVLLITETNVPQRENISYFGRYLPETGSSDEAQLVYNFSLAPLTLHTFHTGDATLLSDWAGALRAPLPGTTFFNFIASHDGIGVMPAQGILSDAAIQALVDRTLAHGGKVSCKANADGSRSVYELNITLYDFLNDPARPQDELDVQRFVASQAILLALAGVPGIYVHSLFGSRNCHRCAEESGHPRSLNREKFRRADIEAMLANPSSHQARVFAAYHKLLRLRRSRPAFHPAGAQRVFFWHPSVFSLLRRANRGGDAVLCLTNVSSHPVTVPVDLAAAGLCDGQPCRDLLDGGVYAPLAGRLTVPLSPYQTVWLVAAH